MREKKEKLTEILSEIPQVIWERIVKEEPEWHNMEPFLERLGFGPFAVLMVATGLNDYQLKGKSEIAYWPKIRNLLDGLLPLKSLAELCDVLKPFYQTERLNEKKIYRLERFLFSPLASELWKGSPQEVSTEFINIWHKLARTMRQESHKKTIVFALKCLGISLLIAGEDQFDFSDIPVPVDYRIERFTKQLGVHVYTDEDVRNLWDEILAVLKRGNPHITMIHLDSLIWQIATMNKDRLQRYFNDLGIPHLSERLSSLSETTTDI